MTSKKKITISLLTAFIVVVTFSACRKNDQTSKKTDKDYLYEKFFSLSDGLSPNLVSINEQLKKQNKEHNFLKSFINTNGFPLWQSAVSNEDKSIQRNINQKNLTPSDSLIFFIPIQSISSSEISSYIVCLKVDTTYSFRLFRKNALDTLTSDLEQRKKFYLGALSVFSFFEKKINNKDSTYIGGIYNKYISDATLEFSNQSGSTERLRSSTFTVSGVTNCYKVSCTEQQGTRTTIDFSCYYCTTSWNINYGGTGTSSMSYWFDDGTGGYSTGGSSSSSSYSPVIQNLIYYLNLNSMQADWLAQNEQRAVEIHYYIQTTTTEQQDAYRISAQHINEMMENSWYLNFVQMYVQDAQSDLVWWEDDIWLSNPNNFNLDIDAVGNQYKELTAAEKALVKKYPVEAALIKVNASTAFSMSHTKMGSTGGLNDKKDAFRHSFFQALNTVTVKVGANITQLFADAHESEVPSQLTLEKQMDLFNNSVGITVGQNIGFWTSVDGLGDIIKGKVDNGELKYLKPLNFIASPRYDANGDKVQDCETCLNGIVSSTVLTPTNQ